MGEWLANLQLAPFAAIAAAVTYFLGVATGWVLWSHRNGALDDVGHVDATTVKQMLALEESIRDAKTRLAEDDGFDADVDKRIDAVDNAVKRANGRLRLLIDSIEARRAS
ncbi:MAG: hypothetical protein AAGC56_10935 [Pseudomonadota bacterium]